MNQQQEDDVVLNDGFVGNRKKADGEVDADKAKVDVDVLRLVKRVVAEERKGRQRQGRAGQSQGRRRRKTKGRVRHHLRWQEQRISDWRLGRKQRQGLAASAVAQCLGES